ncbi:MAG: beta-lactamase family protein [Candidatus Kapabacteria bacterium]|nr:beta-lactamase family protein [Ignavibacteriota bacterium]MCW5885982.1 beta-lactamase family protein [Candidatus Kapabacteria bacterium]
MKKNNQKKIENIINSIVDYKNYHGCAIHIESLDNDIKFNYSAGNLEESKQFYIASINKIMLSAIALKMSLGNLINLDDKIIKYLPNDLTNNLLVIDGKNYTDEITVRHLMSHTSGLPCYLIDKPKGQSSVMESLLSGNDEEWSIDRVVDYAKRIPPKFVPGAPQKASYSDTNFRLLGAILEKASSKSTEELLGELFKLCNMDDTYVITESTANDFAPIYVGNNNISVMNYLISTGQDIVSTAEDLAKFTRKFFDGSIYPESKLNELQNWNNIFFPFKYGTGIQKFYVPLILSLFNKVPDMLGHSGSTGTAAFFVPERNLIITGCTNQAKSPSKLFQMMIKIMNSIK